MNIDRAVMAFAGVMILASVALAYFVSPLWLLLTAFVGVNLLQAAFTGMPAATFLLGDDAIGRDQSVMTLRWAGSGGAHWWWYAQYRDVRGGPLPSRGGELGLVVPF